MAILHKTQLGTNEVEVYTKVIDIAVKKDTVDFSYISTVGDTQVSANRVSIDFNNTQDINIYNKCYSYLKTIYTDTVDC